jgi:hypothetical protein
VKSASARNARLSNSTQLTLVTKNDVEGGKSGNFDGSVSEWLDILLDALFSLGGGKKDYDDIAVSAQISRKKDKLSVLPILRGV